VKPVAVVEPLRCRAVIATITAEVNSCRVVLLIHPLIVVNILVVSETRATMSSANAKFNMKSKSVAVVYSFPFAMFENRFSAYFTCPDCSKMFPRRARFVRHVRREHPENIDVAPINDTLSNADCLEAVQRRIAELELSPLAVDHGEHEPPTVDQNGNEPPSESKWAKLYHLHGIRKRSFLRLERRRVDFFRA
jgi:Zinc finger, C2H2 type